MPIRELSPELAEKAKVELNEDPNRINDDLQHLRGWIAKQPHLRARTDDQWLMLFLRGCKFSLERAKEKLDLFYTIRTTIPELFKIKHTDKVFHDILDMGCNVVLPKTAAPDAPRIVLVRPGTYDPEKYNIMDIMSASFLIQKLVLMEDDNAVIGGIRSILDLENVTMGHFLQMTPFLMKKMVLASQDATPIRMKGTHYLNTPTGFETIFNAMKSLLSEKNKKRLFVHNKNYEELYKHIPKEILPAEYGGNAGTIREITDNWKKKVDEHSSWLEEDEKYGTDESKRPGKPSTAEDMFGLEGSFRTLQFD